MRVVVLLWFVLPVLALSNVDVAPESYVRYRASDARGGWTGQAPVASLELRLDPDDISASSVRVSVEAGAFSSGNLIRDTNARRTVFETAEYPLIEFTASTVRAETQGLTPGQPQTLELRGDLTLHGITRALDLPVEVVLEDGWLAAESSFEILLSDFDMSRPSLFGVTVDDRVELEVWLRIRLEAEP